MFGCLISASLKPPKDICQILATSLLAKQAIYWLTLVLTWPQLSQNLGLVPRLFGPDHGFVSV